MRFLRQYGWLILEKPDYIVDVVSTDVPGCIYFVNQCFLPDLELAETKLIFVCTNRRLLTSC